ncbi:tubulin monoglutamylase TTLL4-like isoform X2 [Toxorhynchites rutilus septentrionalis]|uniref:tubulin monoglutamylase TTLL4-like isoform X2 n=1 Tax=Toxorhynchites rutilus septentrionalis TaxID=329112 RepID=UPI0024792E93|nr:tubulin monoglutamylase TTLL4-like isoform X2 [Toxorhynchites rutilus septentrionalis]
MACHANYSCVCSYITTKFSTIMDFKQQNGQPQFPRSSSRLKHQSSTASNISSSSSAVAPQKISLRRRCHSESLPMAPMHETRSGKSRLHHHHQLKSKGENTSLLIESFSLQGNCRKPLPSIGNNDLLPHISGKSAKENVMHNGHGRFDGGVNAKDVYMNDLDAYRRDRRNGYYIASDRQLESRFARNLESSFNPRNTIFDRSNRKLRPRSESEPHDIYTSSATITSTVSGGRTTPTWSNREYMRDISLKRTRDTISPTLEADEALESIPVPIVLKDSPPSKMLNATDATSLDEGVSKSVLQHRMRLTATTNGLRAAKTVRNRTGTAVNKYKSSLKSAPTTVSAIVASGGVVSNMVGRKSVSPTLLKPMAGSTSPTPSGVSTGTSGGESVHTQDLDTETIGHSDVGDEDDLDDECNGEDDDLDDELGDDEEVLNGSITDSEDNYQTHLAAYQSRAKSTSPSPLLAKGPVTSIGCVLGGSPPEGPLAPSLFANVPPYINFSTYEKKGPPMPPAVHKALKWKMTLITPIIVRKVLLNSGFRLLKKTNDWIGTWGKHMKSPCFKTLRPYQKFNHLPGSFQIGRKDRVWRNLQTQMNRHGKKEFGFMPRTYIIPQDLKLLRQMWPRHSQRNCKWIIKPPASARGTGIKVVNRWSQIPKRKPLIVQRYVDRPLLINGSKFDLRLYVLVTSINPLRVYMHTDGLARFASVKYSEKSDTLSDRYMHLTNYSINKLSNNYSANEDADACQGHKWTIKSLWSYFADQGIDTDRLWGALRNLVLRTILAGEGPIHAMSKLNVASRYNCYELFGIDVLLDSELVPWLLEVNISPSLHSASTLDAHVKGPLVKALLNTVMYQVPPRIPQAEQKEILAEHGLEAPLCFDKRIYVSALSKPERLKHNQFIQKEMMREDYLNTILEELTPDDIRCLLLTEDELARSAPLERILPAPNSHRYIGFTEHPRYYNRLLDAWENRYCHSRAEGIALLQSFCEQKIHLQVPPSTLKKDFSSKPSVSTNCESGSQDSGIQSDPSNSELQSQGSCSAFQSQESIDQIPELIPENTVTATTTTTTSEITSATMGSMGLVAKQHQLETDDDDDNMRLGDRIKLILNDAFLLKQQHCGSDTENAIIIHQ